MVGATEDGVDAVALLSHQEVSVKATITFHVADHGFDGASASQLAANGGGRPLLPERQTLKRFSPWPRYSIGPVLIQARLFLQNR